jgi:hypothetical protein
MINRKEIITAEDGKKVRIIQLEEVVTNGEERTGIPTRMVADELLAMSDHEKNMTKMDGLFYMRMKQYSRLRRVQLTTDLGSSGNM